MMLGMADTLGRDRHVRVNVVHHVDHQVPHRNPTDIEDVAQYDDGCDGRHHEECQPGDQAHQRLAKGIDKCNETRLSPEDRGTGH